MLTFLVRGRLRLLHARLASAGRARGAACVERGNGGAGLGGAAADRGRLLPLARALSRRRAALSRLPTAGDFHGQCSRADTGFSVR